MEKQQLPPVDKMSSVIVTGVQSVINRDALSYQRAFAKYNFTVLTNGKMTSAVRGTSVSTTVYDRKALA